MNFKFEVIVVMALGKFYMLKAAKHKNPYEKAIEIARLEYCPSYDSHDFLGDVTLLKNKMKRDGKFSFLHKENAFHNINPYEISKLLDTFNKKNQEEKDKYILRQREENIAFYHYSTSGGVPDCAHDTLTPYEAELLHVELEEKEIFLDPKSKPINKVKDKSILREVMQLHFSFYYNNLKTT